MRLFLAALAACSQASAAPSSPPPPQSQTRGPGEAPAISLPDAVASAQAYVQNHKIDVALAYLQAAVFDAVSRRWVVDWQLPRAKGGLTIIYVAESGKIDAAYGE
jgi:hypothetical protein